MTFAETVNYGKNTDADSGKRIPVRVTPRIKSSPSTHECDEEDFEVYVRKRSRRFFIGGFTNEMTSEKIRSYVTRRGPKVTMVRTFPQKRTDDGIIVQLNVEENIKCNMLEENGFWPRGILCKPWLSRGALDNKRKFGGSHFASRLNHNSQFRHDSVDDAGSSYNRYSSLSNLD